MDSFFDQKFNSSEGHQIKAGDYDGCIFTDYNFENSDFSGYKFGDSESDSCDLSNIKVFDCAFRDVVFRNCKMLGINFDNANPFNFSVTFSGCTLDHSSFYQLDMRKTKFVDCMVRDADFTEANLANSVFRNTDLAATIFDRSVLDGADFREALNFSINPNQNQIKKAKFSNNNLSGLLQDFNIIIE